MSIQVHQLTKTYGAQKALDHISFEARPGEIVGFLGPNGAGKSTTMKLITGFLEPDAGEIRVCGRKVTARQTFTHEKIGYLPELNPLYPDMYVREYLGFTGGLHKVPDLKKNIESVIEKTGLQPEAHKQIHQLSKGYKQRVGLAAAILHNPEVLILDEPTSGLDPNQILEIRSLIQSLGKDKTILFSSHILQEAEAICDRVIIIHKGKIVADRSMTDLKAEAGHQTLESVFKSYTQ
jgi:ABC-2 type transport system ATP-binding protein